MIFANILLLYTVVSILNGVGLIRYQVGFCIPVQNSLVRLSSACKIDCFRLCTLPTRLHASYLCLLGNQSGLGILDTCTPRAFPYGIWRLPWNEPGLRCAHKVMSAEAEPMASFAPSSWCVLMFLEHEITLWLSGRFRARIPPLRSG